MVDEPSPKQPLLKEKQSTSQANPQIKYFLLNILAILLAVVAIALSIILIWNRLNTAQLEQSLSQVRAELQQTQIQMQSDITATRNKITQLVYQAGQTTPQQALAEIAYLIRIAHVHLMIENNPTLAIRLLKIAQQSLQNLPSDTVSSLTQAINQDVAVLSATPQINIMELSDRLDQFKSEIANLPIQPKTIPPTKTETISPSTSTQWWEKIKHNLGGIKNLFIIRRIDHPAIPLLELRQILFLKENLQLKLLQAQLALLNRDSFLYQKSLDAVVQLLTDCDSNQPELTEIIKKIQALAIINLNPSMPPLQSLQTFNHLVTGKTRGTE